MSADIVVLRRRPPKLKIYHKAALINQNGDVSALCFSRPRKINLKVATWTLRWEAVTCPRCMGKKLSGVAEKEVVDAGPRRHDGAVAP